MSLTMAWIDLLEESDVGIFSETRGGVWRVKWGRPLRMHNTALIAVSEKQTCPAVALLEQAGRPLLRGDVGLEEGWQDPVSTVSRTEQQPVVF